MRALIFAAGLGTRLKPLTDSCPKALVPVCGEPLLSHVLRRLRAAGYDDIVVNAYHFADQVIDYLAGHAPDVRVSDERGVADGPLETGGGILHARPLLQGEPFLVHNVDILSNLDLGAFRAALREDALATLVVSERSTQRYLLFDEGMRLVGWTNIATGEVRSPYPCLDAASCRKLAFSGISYFAPSVFDVMGEKGFSGKFSTIDFLLSACADHPVYGYESEGLSLLDVGKPASLEMAETFLRK